jgi:hypothetical protein
MVFRFQKRQQVICGHCGFDPVLYRRNRDLARKKVEEFWAKKLNISSSEDEHSVEADSVRSDEVTIGPGGDFGDELSESFDQAGHSDQFLGNELSQGAELPEYEGLDADFPQNELSRMESSTP